jgi:octanoyl-[GcvH]:protein N-octanoyltransferase
VRDSARVRDVLVPVYEALDLSFDPATAGSVEDELPDVSLEDVEAALIEELSALYEIEEADLDEATIELARELRAEHLAPGA